MFGSLAGVADALLTVSLVMHTRDFEFDLPAELIAQQPTLNRQDSRLLVLASDSEGLQDQRFTDLPKLLRPGDVLVFNDTRVIPARLYGRKASGGRVEVLVERIIAPQRVLAHVRANHAPRPGTQLLLDHDRVAAVVIDRHEALYELEFMTHADVLDILNQHGHIPLPPYIERAAQDFDAERYQTVYAREPGAVAAPTAGLHFSAELLATLVAQGVEQAFITLHVGAGTFQPVRVDSITAHRMHAERVEVSAAVCEQIRAAKARGGRVVAVGTTVVRSLEAACAAGTLQPLHGETALFIYPGYTFRCIDALITNFHLPGSTLLMLVSAFAGHQRMMTAYRHAVQQRYRFFSYGDAMWISRV